MASEPSTKHNGLSHVWREFCAQLVDAGEVLDRAAAPDTAFDQAEGLRYLSRLTRTALNMLVDSGDPDFPRIFQLTDDQIKIGADNPDNIYQQAVVRGDREYRIRGTRGTVPYLSIGTKANRYATEGTMMSTGEIEFADVALNADGTFEIIVSAKEHPGNWLPMADDTTFLIIRQTFDDKKTQIPADMQIERISDGPAVPALLTADTIQQQLQGSAAWVRGTANTFADWSEWFKSQPNRIYDADQTVFYRGGGDPKIWYGHIYYDLAPGEALEIRVNPPAQCRMWNFQIDNWWMESLDYRFVKCTVNKTTAKLESDGKLILVLSAQDPGFGNWLDTAGHNEGTVLLRWAGATDNPLPEAKVVKLADIRK